MAIVTPKGRDPMRMCARHRGEHAAYAAEQGFAHVEEPIAPKVVPTAAKYTAEQKRRAVKRSAEIGVEAAAEEAGCSPSALYEWRKAAGAKGTRKQGSTAPYSAKERARLLALAREQGVQQTADAEGVTTKTLKAWIAREEQKASGDLAERVEKAERERDAAVVQARSLAERVKKLEAARGPEEDKAIADARDRALDEFADARDRALDELAAATREREALRMEIASLRQRVKGMPREQAEALRAEAARVPALENRIVELHGHLGRLELAKQAAERSELTARQEGERLRRALLAVRADAQVSPAAQAVLAALGVA